MKIVCMNVHFYVFYNVCFLYRLRMLIFFILYSMLFYSCMHICVSVFLDKFISVAIQVNEKRTITIVTTQTQKKDAPCVVVVTMPSGKTVELTVTKITEGYSAIFTSTEVGIHKVSIKYAGQELPKSPYSVSVETKVEVTEVTVTGLDTRK